MDDRELLRRYAEEGDQEAFAAVVGRYVDLVHGVARRQVPGEAEDVTQAVFLLLAEKAGEVAGHPTVAGWLFRVTWNCCASVRRSGRRRENREREAGRMMKTDETMEVREELVRAPDAVLEALPGRYRDAVLLRYLQGRTIEETGAMLGLTPGAAAKRALRGLEQLRKRFSRAGYAVGAGSVAALLSAEAAKGAPAGIVHAIASGTASGGMTMTGATKAAMLAKGAGKTVAVWKGAAAVAAAVAIAGGTGLAAHRWVMPAMGAAPETVMTAAPLAPAAVGEDAVDETKVPGMVSVAAVDLVVDAQGAEALKKVTEGITCEATFFELRRGNAGAVRAALGEMVAAGQLVKVKMVTQHALSASGSYSLMSPGLSNGVPIVRDGRGVTVGTTMGGQPGAGGLLAQSAGEKAKLEFHFKDGTATVSSAPVDGNGRMPPGPNAPGVDRLVKPTALNWSGMGTPGEAVVMVGDFGEFAGDHAVMVRVYEIYKSTEFEARYMRALGDGNWLERGPAGMRRIADAALVWAAKGDEVKKDAEKWTKTLSDGTTVRLVAVQRPDEMPLCRWGPDGEGLMLPENVEPVARMVPAENGRGGQRAPGYTVTLKITSPDGLADSGPWGNMRQVAPEGDRARLYVGVGPWKVEPITLNKKVQVGSANVVLWQVNKIAQGITLMGDGEMTFDTEVHLGVVTKDGRQVMARNMAGAWDAVFRPAAGAGGQVNVPADQVDHYVVATREREEVVIEGFKDRPALAMPERVTAEEVRAAEATLKGRLWVEEWGETTAALARIEGMARDASTPVGALRVMLEKARAGDVKGVRECLEADEEMANAAAESLVAYVQGQEALLKKFGTEAVHRAVWQDFHGEGQWEFDAKRWVIVGEKATNSGEVMVLREGKWRVEIGERALIGMFKQYKAEDEAFRRALEEGKFGNAGEAVKGGTMRYAGVPLMKPLMGLY